jgi:putative ABC transport system permease protein
MTLLWIRNLLTRRSGRIASTAAGVAISVALLATIGGFLGASKATMTSRAVANVAVDWQVEVQPGADPTSVLDTVKTHPGVIAALEVGYGQTTGFVATTGATTQRTGPGYVLGIPAAYRSTFPSEVRQLSGATNGVLVAQQTAANLHVTPGDTVTVGRPGGGSTDVTVAGVVDLPQADALFQKVGAPPGAQPTAPPDNVILIPADQWHQLYDPISDVDPQAATTQIHVAVTHDDLSPDPAIAYGGATGNANNLEVSLAGAGLVSNNLAATLGAARSDALYAQVLFVFLGIPGAVLGGILTAVVAGAGADRRRREQALLRSRGANRSLLVRIGAAEALAVAGIGGAVGIGAAALVAKMAFGTFSFGATTGTALAWMAAALFAGLVVAMLTVALPARRSATETTVSAGRSTAATAPVRRWRRYGLDLWMLAAGAVVFWITSRAGYTLVLAAEGVPSISVDYWAFAGPALLWGGIGLLVVRLSDTFLEKGRRVLTRTLGPVAGRLAPTVASSMTRQRRMLTTGVTLVALTTLFAVSVSTFNATYRQQAEVDALLTNGADVTVTESPGVVVGPDAATTFAAVPGVNHVETLQHRFAYVGSDLQDLYGVNPDTIVSATQLQDAYFAGGTASGLMAQLAATPNGVLVSAETVHDFQLAPGDHLTLRLQDGVTKQFRNVDFTYVGVAKEFPTAPSDSFLVANASYVAAETGSDALGSFLIDTGTTPPDQVAGRITDMVGDTAQVTDIVTTRRIVGSSLTAVDLAGLTRVELGFALALAAASTVLVLVLGIVERRKTFAILSALGATRSQIASLIASEATYVTIGGLIAGGFGGWLMSEMLVKVLNGVFDPPPSTLAIPVAYLVAVAAAMVVGVVMAVLRGSRSAASTPISVLRAQ